MLLAAKSLHFFFVCTAKPNSYMMNLRTREGLPWGKAKRFLHVQLSCKQWTTQGAASELLCPANTPVALGAELSC